MRNRTEWVDHVLSKTGLFNVLARPNEGADVYAISPHGEVMQPGTMQDANHFNNIEDSLDAHETAINILVNALRCFQEGETEQIRLDDARLAIDLLLIRCIQLGDQEESEVFDLTLSTELLLNSSRMNHWKNEDRLDSHDTQIASLDRQTTELYKVDVISKSFTNTSKYPFNNSKASVALTNARENTNYIVIPEVTAFAGNVGEVIITEKLTNGFKAEYTGSAVSATIKFTVIGGYNK